MIATSTTSARIPTNGRAATATSCDSGAKISGIRFDTFGDFEGFLLRTPHGSHHFSTRERDMETIVKPRLEGSDRHRGELGMVGQHVRGCQSFSEWSQDGRDGVRCRVRRARRP